MTKEFKHRKGYRFITVDGIRWQYMVGQTYVNAYSEKGENRRGSASDIYGWSGSGYSGSWDGWRCGSKTEPLRPEEVKDWLLNQVGRPWVIYLQIYRNKTIRNVLESQGFRLPPLKEANGRVYKVMGDYKGVLKNLFTEKKNILPLIMNLDPLIDKEISLALKREEN